MNKRLLTKDYKRIVLDSFNIPKSDYYKYYLNLVESNYQYNTDIIEQLIEILNEFIEINKSEVYAGLIPVENKNGKIEYVDINQTFEVDENGNKTPFNLEEPLFPFQIKTIGIIKDAISLKNNLIEYENKLPEPIRKYFKENPMPEGFDFSDLKKRIEIISQIPELLKQHKEALQKVIDENDIKELITDKNTEELKNDISHKIKKHFDFFRRNCPRKNKQIINNKDFQKLIDWTIFFFENDFNPPEIIDPIEVVNTNKTFVQLAFKYLFKELKPSNTFPKSLFDFYCKAFFPYRNDKIENFDKVRNNDDIKKLMKLEY